MTATTALVSGSPGVTDTVARSRAAQRVWATVDVRDRAAALLRLHDLVLARREELTAIVAAATGKSRRDAFLEIAAVLTIARYYGLSAPRMLRPRRRMITGVFVPGLITGVERRIPAGVVANIAAWNFPLVFLFGDTVPAVAAGNGVVLKPDPRSDEVAAAVLWLMSDAGLPDGLVGAVTGGTTELGEELIDAADHVLFTGSTRVGRLVAERAGRNLTGVTLELGGKNAMYVAEDADVAAAAEAAVRDCFGALGQVCTATERIYVHADIREAFVRRFVERTRALRLGVEPEADLGRLTSSEHLATVEAFVADAVRRGATVLAGGKARPDLGPACYEPTILADVPADARVSVEETFGPVVFVTEVSHDEAALAQINLGDAGLMASVWTRDTARGRRLAARIRAGTVVVNETYHIAWGSPGLPLGGLGTSGLGRRFGADGLREVTRAQVTLVHRGGLVRRVVDRPAPQTEAVLVGMARAMRALRWP